MSWIMKAKLLNIKQVTVYAATKEYMNLMEIRYKWELMK